MTNRGHVFISYARADDAEFVDRLRTDLQAGGLHVWWDESAMESRGAGFLHELQDAIRSADRVVLVTGPAAGRSDYVEAEWRFALDEACTAVTPVFRSGGVDEAPPGVQHLHGVDFGDDGRYREALYELIRLLRSQPAAQGPLWGVDALPPYHVRRPDVERDLAAAVMPDLGGPVAVPGEQSVTSLVGMPGSGKSVVAAAFARLCATRWAFGDGIVWARVGESASAPAVLQRVAQRLQVPAAALSEHLSDRRCLIVLDDVWDQKVVEHVADALGPVCRVLLTTRRGDLAIAARSLHLDVMAGGLALQLLTRAAGRVDAAELPGSAETIIDECGGLPLALAMVGAALAGKPEDRWATMLDRLRGARLGDIRHRLPRYDHPTLLAAMEAATAALDSDPDVPDHARARYEDLAAFERDGEIPEPALAVVWAATGLDPGGTQDLCDLLVSRSLLRRSVSGRYTLHNLQADYLQGTHPDLSGLHGRVVAAYRECCDGDWAAGPNDGHYFQQLPVHMRDAGLTTELAELLGDPDWIVAKLAATDPWTLAADEVLVPGNADEQRLLYEALRRSVPALAAEARQLAPQLLGRLGGVDVPALAVVLGRMREQVDGTWLEPVWATLDQPGGPLRWTLEGHVGAAHGVAATPDGRHAVVGTTEGHVVLWDLATGRRRIAFHRPDAHVWGVAVTDDARRVAAALDVDGVAVWDVASAQELPTAWEPGVAVRGVAFVDGGARLAIGTGEGEVAVLALDGSPLDPLAGRHVEGVQSLVAAPGGRIVVTGDQGGAVAAWDVQARRQLWCMPAHDSGVWSVACDRDGARCLSVANHNTVVLSALETGETLASFATGVWSFGCCLLDDGRAVTSDADGELKIWKLPEGERIGGLRAHDAMADRVAAAGGARVVSVARDGTARVWDLDAPTGTEVSAHGGPVYGVAVSAELQGVMAASEDRMATAWGFDSGARLLNIELKRWGRRVAFVPGTTLILVGDADGIVHLVNLRGPEMLRSRQLHVPAVDSTPEGGTGFGLGGVTGLGVSPPVAWSFGADGDLALWHLERDEIDRSSTELEPPVVGAVATRSDRAVVGAGDGLLRAGPLSGGLEARSPPEPAAACVAVAIDAVGAIAVSSHVDGAVIAWRLDDRKAGYLELGGTADATIMHLESGMKLPIGGSLQAPVMARGLAVSADGRLAVGAFSDGWVRVWELARLAQVAAFRCDEALFSCAIDGKMIAAGGARRVHLLELHEETGQDAERPASSLAMR